MLERLYNKLRDVPKLTRKFYSHLRTMGGLGPKLDSFSDPKGHREECELYEVQPDVSLITFWIDEHGRGGGGTGPGVALYCCGFETLRFDCFGGDKGHFHITPLTFWKLSRRRILYPEDTVEAHIQRTMFELTHNLDYYLQLNPKRRIRNLKIDRERMAAACQQASKTLHRYLATAPALQPLKPGPALESRQAHLQEPASGLNIRFPTDL